MSNNFLYVLFFSFLFVFSRILAQPGRCDFVKNISSDAFSLPLHQYVIIEDCLYYQLSREADKLQEKPNSLVILPPTKNAGDHITLDVHGLTIHQLWINEMWKEMNVNGYIEMEWNDWRMHWSSSEWKIDKLPIKSFGHLWVPDLFSGSYGTATQGNDITVFKDIFASSDGKVHAKLEYRMQALCEVEYKQFPNDERFCCFRLHSGLFNDVIVFNVLSHAGVVDTTRAQTNWHVPLVEVASEPNGADGTPLLKVCLKALRKSTTLRIELNVPMVISALLVLVAPLFGSLKHQLWVKLFSLLLQFMCFRFLIEKTPQLGLGDQIPDIYKFYELTVVVTVVSIVINGVLAALSRAPRSLPPPHRLTLVASAINRRWCCSSEAAPSDSKAQLPESVTAGYARDWREVFSAINGILSLIVVILYVIAMLILCT